MNLENEQVGAGKMSCYVEDKESELFALIWLLDSQGYIYYDNDPKDLIWIDEVRSFLKMKNFPYTEGVRNRNYLSVI